MKPTAILPAALLALLATAAVPLFAQAEGGAPPATQEQPAPGGKNREIHGKGRWQRGEGRGAKGLTLRERIEKCERLTAEQKAEQREAARKFREEQRGETRGRLQKMHREGRPESQPAGGEAAK
ncbi:MAG: hypothetical protein WC789_05800 [Lentisphaeria bacterium]|jgi:Spy/CpxP family protein refolding chaperone